MVLMDLCYGNAEQLGDAEAAARWWQNNIV